MLLREMSADMTLSLGQTLSPVLLYFAQHPIENSMLPRFFDEQRPGNVGSVIFHAFFRKNWFGSSETKKHTARFYVGNP